MQIHYAGTGIIKVDTGHDIDIQADSVGIYNAARTQVFASFQSTAVRLRHNNIPKFETASTGVTITGKGTSALTVAADAAATLATKSYVDASAPSGTFTGSKVFASGTLLELFKIKKATTGALIFDVYLSASLSGSSNKKYTVAHYLGSTPTYNKIIDSGFTAAGGDLVVSFINSTTTATGDSVTCNITSTNAQTVSYTVQAGFDSVNAVSIL